MKIERLKTTRIVATYILLDMLAAFKVCRYMPFDIRLYLERWD